MYTINDPVSGVATTDTPIRYTNGDYDEGYFNGYNDKVRNRHEPIGLTWASYPDEYKHGYVNGAAHYAKDQKILAALK
jgi:hypothetical protein